MNSSPLPDSTRVVLLAPRTPPPDTPVHSGIPRNARELAYGLAGRGVDVHLVTTSNSGRYETRRYGGVRFHLVPFRDFPRRPLPLRLPYSLYWLRFAREASRLVHQLASQAPVLVDATNHEAPALFLAERPAHVRLIVRAVTPSAFAGYGITKRISPGQLLSLTLEGAALRAADLVIYDSEACRRVGHFAYGAHPGREAVCLFALSWVRAREGALPTRHGGSAIHVGRVSWRKGSDLMLQAFARVVQEEPHAELVLVGDDQELDDPGRLGPVWGALSPMARARVRRLGIVNDDTLAASRASAALAIVPSRFESFGNPALEAMAEGLPVLASASGALPEVVGEGEDAGGLLFRAEDVNELAHNWVRLLRSPPLRQTLGERGRRRAMRMFSFDDYLDRTLSLYQRTLRDAPQAHA